jgi:hypothetical protein
MTTHSSRAKKWHLVYDDSTWTSKTSMVVYRYRITWKSVLFTYEAVEWDIYWLSAFVVNVCFVFSSSWCYKNPCMAWRSGLFDQKLRGRAKVGFVGFTPNSDTPYPYSCREWYEWKYKYKQEVTLSSRSIYRPRWVGSCLEDQISRPWQDYSLGLTKTAAVRPSLY